VVEVGDENVLGRAEGAGTEDQRAAANTPFGVGIEERGAGNGGGGSAGAGGGGGGSGEGGGGSAGGSADPQSGSEALSASDRERIARAEEPAASASWTIGIWLAVLVCAGVFWLVLRGGWRQRPVA